MFQVRPSRAMLKLADGPGMAFRLTAVKVLALITIALSAAVQCPCAPQQPKDVERDIRPLLTKLAKFSEDPCQENPTDEVPDKIASDLFYTTTDIVLQEMNTSPASQEIARRRAEEALKRIERMSAEINAAWPEQNRFHFQVLNLPPALIIKMEARTLGGFFVFGIPEEDSGKPNRLWHEVDSDYEFSNDAVPETSLDLYALHRGPSGKARFLAEVTGGGCAGFNIGVTYDAREWDPTGYGHVKQIIDQSGSLRMSDEDSEFPSIGKLQTRGPAITLPYCWFSAIDTWHHATLCAVDTYDLSGNQVKFLSREYNRPDLLPIATTIEYAQKRDYPAVRAYCASDDVAHSLVRDIPPFFFAMDLQVTRTGEGKEHVEMAESKYRFDVEKRGGRWLVVAFSEQ